MNKHCLYVVKHESVFFVPNIGYNKHRRDVLKHDVATMYRGSLVKQREAIPGKSPIGQTLFYTIVKNITGGGKQQEAHAGEGGLHQGKIPHRQLFHH